MRVRTLYVLVALLYLSSSAAGAENKPSLCGKIRLQSPFMDPNSSSNISSSWLRGMILCKSGKLYFRTSIGLFSVSSIDYSARTLTVVPKDHPTSCSKSDTYVHPTLLFAGLPSQSSSLFLFNCRNRAHPVSYPIRNCSGSHIYTSFNTVEGQSCLVVDDIEKLGNSFHPEDLNCSHFINVHRIWSTGESSKEYNLGMKVSFEVDHKPDLCQECRRANGRCGVGLKCFCHLARCVDKVVPSSTASRHMSKKIVSSLFSIGVLIGYLLRKI